MRENPSQKGDKSMNNIINQLSQIEEKTVAILDGAADKKKTLAAEYEAKTKQFDEELNHETELEIQSMRQKMEAEAAAELDRQKTAAGDQIARLEQHYEEKHSWYVDSLPFYDRGVIYGKSHHLQCDRCQACRDARAFPHG